MRMTATGGTDRTTPKEKAARVVAHPAAEAPFDAPVEKQGNHGCASEADARCISTSIPDQHAFILKALRAGPKTSYELRRGGSYQPPTRIFELRELGFNIETTRVTVTDRDGFTHIGVALYELIAEPSGSAS